MTANQPDSQPAGLAIALNALRIASILQGIKGFLFLACFAVVERHSNAS